MGSCSDIYIGLMSGTSLDGLDCSIVDFTNSTPVALYCQTRPYPDLLVQRIRDLISADSITIDQLCQLDVEIAHFYADVVNQALLSASIAAEEICAIGCHGQTIRHNPEKTPVFTLQIGDPNTLSARTGITTVADFRRRDMALGGQGAPLAPAFHQFMFRSQDCDRIIINIGGIANITYLPAAPDKQIIGFDTGPGNTLLDNWIHKHQAKYYDDNGAWAASGQVIDGLLQSMLTNEAYFSQALPKSTGTEYFSPEWLNAFSPEKYKPVDVQATLLDLSAQTIVKGIHQLGATQTNCYACGGGVHNQQLIGRLRSMLPGACVNSTVDLGLDPDYIEAIAFAWLARQTINGQPGNLPSVTSASTSTILGGVFQGNPPKF